MKRKIQDNLIGYYRDDGETFIASVEEKTEKNHCLIVLSGNVNSDVAFELNEEILTLIALKKDVSIDVENMEYVSATFVDDLIALERKMEKERGKSILISNMRKDIFDELAKDGFVHSLDIRVKGDSK